MTTHTDQRSAMLESLSAMFDDQANEDDLQRLLGNDNLEKDLEAFHAIQQSLHKESAMDLSGNKSLVAGVREQIALQESPTTQSASYAAPSVAKIEESEKSEEQPSNIVPLTQRVRSLWPSLAVAASVAFVVVLGGDFLIAPQGTMNSNQVAQQQLNDQVSHPVTPLDELHKPPLEVDNVRLQNYLRQHAEQATISAGQGMIPMARLASYPVED